MKKLSLYEKTISIFNPLISPQDVFDVFEVIDKDYPELFFIDVQQHPIEVSSNGIYMKVSVFFLYDIETILNYKHKLRRIQDNIISKSEEYRLPDERLRLAYNSVVKNVSYNYAEISPADYTIIGPFINHMAICAGYAKALKFLCDSMNINCLIVSGTVLNDVNGNNENHAWNIITLDNVNYFHVDSTWDSTNNRNNYKYYKLSDSSIAGTHFWNRNTLPACAYDGNENKITCISLKSVVEIQRFLLQEVKLKKEEVSFFTDVTFNTTQEVFDLVYGLFLSNPKYGVKHINVFYRKKIKKVECTFEYF